MKEPKSKRSNFGVKDLAMLLFIILTVSCTIISVFMLRSAYENSNGLNATINLSSLTDSSQINPKTTITTKKSSTTRKKTSRTVKTTSQTQPKALRSVCINTATADEISDCLNIDIALAERIVDVRNRIHVFSSSLELLLVDGFSESMHERLKDYIIL